VNIEHVVGFDIGLSSDIEIRRRSSKDGVPSSLMIIFKFQFKVLTEGLTNVRATFQTVVDSIFHPYINKFVVVYINDILDFSRLKVSIWHSKRMCASVSLVLKVLKREKVYVCKAKSSFAQKEKYLGPIVDRQGIRLDPKKVEAVQT
jgi:hypothetical protein